MAPTPIGGAALSAWPPGRTVRRIPGERRGLAIHGAAGRFEFVFQLLVFAPQPLALGFRTPQVLTQSLDLPRLIMNDLLRVTRRGIVGAPRHAQFMSDSGPLYKYEILDLPH
jgi:hypothetical protein